MVCKVYENKRPVPGVGGLWRSFFSFFAFFCFYCAVFWFYSMQQAVRALAPVIMAKDIRVCSSIFTQALWTAAVSGMKVSGAAAQAAM